MICFDEDEIMMIKDALNFRKDIHMSNSKQIKQINKILIELSYPFYNLNSLQKSIIHGCIWEFIVDPNINLITKSDYELFMLVKDIRDDYKKIDIGLSILNKLKKKRDTKKQLFKETFEKIDKVLNSSKIYYSITNDGKIYKVGIVTGENEGLHMELNDNSSVSNFKIGYINRDSYMKVATKSELINLFDSYKRTNELNDGQKRFVRMIEK